MKKYRRNDNYNSVLSVLGRAGASIKSLFMKVFYRQPPARASRFASRKPELNVRNVAIAAVTLALVVTLVVVASTRDPEPAIAEVSNEPQTELLPKVGYDSPLIPHDEQVYIIPANPDLSVIPAPELKKGVTHDDVMKLQSRLTELEYMDGDEPTRYFGPATEEAVLMFQRNNELTEDGVAGEKTLELLYSEDAPVYMAKKGVSGTDVEEFQKRLVELGYMEKATGNFGDETEAAVKEFQKRNDLSQDGKIGPATSEKLYSEQVVAFSFGFGSEGDDIKELQQRLKKLGYISGADGKYGSETVAAVKRFQTKHSLIADGHVGPTTKKLLFSSDAQPNALTIGDNGDDVKKVQQRLKNLGYLSSADGYYGEKTESAVKSFQKKNKLSQDGKVGAQTMNKLFSSSAVKSGGGTAGSPGSGTSSKLSRFIAAAESKLGCKYVRGAKGPNKFDCSGFAYWCLNQAGVNQSYMTSYAWRSCKKYTRINDIDDVKRGDVIIYKMGATKGHVGIAISGSTMIDASSSKGKVVKRSFKTSYWRKTFYCAYRIF